MSMTRLFLKMTKTEHNILNVAKTKMEASSYREVIVTLLEGEYIDCLCSSVLTEKALRKIIVNLNQLSRGCDGNEAFSELVSMITHVTSVLTDLNNRHLQPVFCHREERREIQIRLTRDEKDTAASAKSAAGFRTYCDLIMHLCCAYIADTFNLPTAPDYTALNEVGTALNEEAKWFNTNDTVNTKALNRILDSLYGLVSEIYESIGTKGGHNVP